MHKINKISPDEHKFLQIISTIDNSIKSLYFMGTLPSERIPAVAIVGTRKPTTYGKEIGYQLAYELAKQGIAIISGLALGIDGIAHRAALDAGGTTIAVLPTSIEHLSPRAHRQLALNILSSKGALISEYSPEDLITKSNFLARNRIVSALSDGIVIIEAAGKSGTLATAAFALNQGKSVMALPGHITSPASEGCNKLIAKGARLIMSTDDILDELGLTPKKHAQTTLPLAYSAEEKVLIDLLYRGVQDGDELLRHSNLSTVDFLQTLTTLELQGTIKALGGNKWALSRR